MSIERASRPNPVSAESMQVFPARLTRVLAIRSVQLSILVIGVTWAFSYLHSSAIEIVGRGQLWRITSSNGRVLADNQPQRDMETQMVAARAAQLKQLRDKRWVVIETHTWAEVVVDDSLVIAQRINAILRTPVPLVHPPATFSCGYRLPFALAMAMLVGLHSPSLRAYIRRRRGLCANCGYDLRATPQRCPECGVAPRGTSSHSHALRKTLERIGRATAAVARHAAVIATPTIESPFLLFVDLCGWVLLLVSIPAVLLDIAAWIAGRPAGFSSHARSFFPDTASAIFGAALIWLVYHVSICVPRTAIGRGSPRRHGGHREHAGIT